MKWASTIRDDARLDRAVEAACQDLREQLDGKTPHLALVFVSSDYGDDLERLPMGIATSLQPGLILGCTAGGLIGGGREVEDRAGLSMIAAVLPDVDLSAFHIDANALPSDAAGIERALGVGCDPAPQFILLPDPFTFDTEIFLRCLDATYPDSGKIGGLASGGRRPGSNFLFLGDQVFHSGAVGVAMTGDVVLDTVVAQGCRPIGEPMFVTRRDRNILIGVDGEKPLDVLRELHERLEPRDQELVRHSLFLGIVMDPQRQEYHQGDFLIRNLAGVDPDSGVMAVGALLEESSVVQFHLRDARTSAEDLEAHLLRYREEPRATPPAGALLFSCLGRGKHLYGSEDHDSRVFRDYLGEIPLGGFFCNGEIGPVQKQTFLHGYTSAFGLFRKGKK
jgi:small ligand-binding sensory domain FIST